MERPENIFEVNAAEEALRSAVDRINPADVKLALDSGANPNISQKNSQDSILNGLVSKSLPAPSDIEFYTGGGGSDLQSKRQRIIDIFIQSGRVEFDIKDDLEKTLCDGLIVNGDVSSAAQLILAQIEQALEKGRAVYTINFAALFSDIGHNANPDEASRMSAMEKIENIHGKVQKLLTMLEARRPELFQEAMENEGLKFWQGEFNAPRLSQLPLPSEPYLETLEDIENLSGQLSRYTSSFFMEPPDEAQKNQVRSIVDEIREKEDLARQIQRETVKAWQPPEA